MKKLNTKEAAEIISEMTGKPFSRRRIQDEIKNGNIKGEKMGRDYFITLSDIEHYHRRRPGPKPKNS